MSRTYANILADILQAVQDAGAATYASAETTIAIRESLFETSRFAPYIVMEPFTAESRSGKATSTSSGNLVDANKSQFVAGDVNKVVYNSDDKTWAVITSYSSATTVGLSKDIMASGEHYYIFNERCFNAKQINISDIDDYLWVQKLEYPTGIKRNFEIEGDILTIGLDSDPDDTSKTGADVDVFVWFALPNKISQLTDLAGEVDLVAGYSEGDTSMVVDGLTTGQVIEKGQEFTIEGTRLNYRVTADVTIADSEAKISFFPPLECDIDDGADVTFKQSTLKSWFEPYFVQYAAGKLAVNKAALYYLQVKDAVTTLATVSSTIGNMTARLNQSILDLTAGRTEANKLTTIIDEASAEIDKTTGQINQALLDLTKGRSFIGNYTPKALEYASYASHDITNARGYLDTAQGFFREANSREGNQASFVRTASGELNNAGTYLNQAMGYLRKATAELSSTNAARNLEAWGYKRMQDAIKQMESMVQSGTTETYYRG